MNVEGGCYCGALRYQAEGEPLFKGQCHCRECQYITGGSVNVVMGMPEARYKLIAFAGSSFFAGIAGALFASFVGKLPIPK